MKGVMTKAAATVAATALALAPFVARAQRGNPNTNPLQNVAVTGTATDGTPFAGSLDIQRFEVVGDQLLAVGDLSGKLGNQPVNHQAVALPVQIPQGGLGALLPGTKALPASLHGGAAPLVIPAQATCPVLTLDLGPLDLNLLGLQVHLNEVVLTITAQSGSGNLLGNLLCDVANLLNGGGTLTQIGNLLNQIANILNGVGL